MKPTIARRWLIVAACALPVLIAAPIASAGIAGSADPAAVSLFAKADTRQAVVDPDRAPVEVGVRFTSRRSGFLTAVRFLPVPGDASPHPVSLWSAGHLLATATGAAGGAGWQQVALPRPVPVTAGTEYVASYHTERYLTTQHFFDRPATTGPLSAPAHRNGVYHYGASAAPDDSWNASSYWVDVVFTTAAGVAPSTRPRSLAPTTSPTVQPTAQPTGTRPAPTKPAPAPTPTRAPTPPSTGRPDASNTGVPAGTRLTPSGSLRISTAGAVVENLDITGTVEVDAADVTIRDCRIHGSAPFGVRVLSGHVTITDSELYGFSEAAVIFDDWTAERVDIHSVGSDGVKFGSNTTLRDSYLHDFTPDPGSHADGGQLQSGVTNVAIVHNTIVGGDNSALFMAPDQGPSAAGPVLITDNLLGGGNYTLFIVDGADGTYHQRGYTVTGNRFQRGSRYGPVDSNEPASSFDAWSGNVFDDTGTPVTR